MPTWQRDADQMGRTISLRERLDVCKRTFSITDRCRAIQTHKPVIVSTWTTFVLFVAPIDNVDTSTTEATDARVSVRPASPYKLWPAQNSLFDAKKQDEVSDSDMSVTCDRPTATARSMTPDETPRLHANDVRKSSATPTNEAPPCAFAPLTRFKNQSTIAIPKSTFRASPTERAIVGHESALKHENKASSGAADCAIRVRTVWNQPQ